MTSNSEALMQQLGQEYKGTQLKPLYTAVVTVTPGQEGHSRLSSHAHSSDDLLNVDLAFPKELGGHGQGTNPEQLFAAGYAACFQGALALVAKNMSIVAAKAIVTCAVTISRDPVDGGYKLAAKLTIAIPNVDRAKAEQAVIQAHKLCPYSKAIQGNVDVEVLVL